MPAVACTVAAAVVAAASALPAVPAADPCIEAVEAVKLSNKHKVIVHFFTEILLDNLRN
jgi:hypothetical protein